MLNRFSEMIKNGVATANYTEDTFSNTIVLDGFSRLYNNVWGVVSDTRMTPKETGAYVITGSQLRNQEKFTNFLNSMNLGGCIFKQATGYNTAMEYFSSKGLEGTFDTQNGDIVYVLTTI